MKSPCEVIIWYILPSIRSELIKKLIEKGMSRKEASRTLGITKAAVSQYIYGKRGDKIEFKQNVRSAIEKLAEDVITKEKNVNLIYRICEICTMLKRDKTVCELHREHNLLPFDCEACFKQ